MRDRLGSVVTLTNHHNLIMEHRSYDPFGKPRYGTMQASSTATLLTIASGTPFTQRGFTDHEHIDEAQLIHMNGRVYDYNLGRFLSVDPFIQAPGNSQSLNPYSYIMNNPLAGTDPSGYIAVASVNCRESMDACAALLSGKNPTQMDIYGAAVSNGKLSNEGTVQEKYVNTQELLAPNSLTEQSKSKVNQAEVQTTSGGTDRANRQPVFASKDETLQDAVENLNALSEEGQFDTVGHDFTAPVELVHDPDLVDTPDPVTGDAGYMEHQPNNPNIIRVSSAAREDLNSGAYRGLKMGHELIHIKDHYGGVTSRAQSEINAYQWEHDNIERIFYWSSAKSRIDVEKNFLQINIKSWTRRLDDENR